MRRQLWIDTRGEPVITTTPNGTRNAKRWGWIEAVAVPSAAAPAETEALARAWDEGALWRHKASGFHTNGRGLFHDGYPESPEYARNPYRGSKACRCTDGVFGEDCKLPVPGGEGEER